MWRCGVPEPRATSCLSPSGVVSIHDWGAWHGINRFLTSRGNGFAYALLGVTDRTQANVHPQNAAERLLDLPLEQIEITTQRRHGCCQSRPYESCVAAKICLSGYLAKAFRTSNCITNKASNILAHLENMDAREHYLPFFVAHLKLASATLAIFWPNNFCCSRAERYPSSKYSTWLATKRQQTVFFPPGRLGKIWQTDFSIRCPDGRIDEPAGSLRGGPSYARKQRMWPSLPIGGLSVRVDSWPP